MHEAVDSNIGPSAVKWDLKGVLKMALGVGIGSFLEYYSWALIAYFSSELKTAYFPQSTSSKNTLLEEFSLYGIGFIVRPFGSMIFGTIADKYGRVYGMRMSIIAMAVPTVIFGLIPDFATIGYGATCLAILCRIAQGLSVGGELGTAVTYTVEEAPENMKAFMIGILWSTSSGAWMALLAYDIWDWSDDTSTRSWTWRIPFVLSFVIAIFGYYMRSFMPESFAFTILQDTANDNENNEDNNDGIGPLQNPVKIALRYYWKEIIILTCSYAGPAAVYYSIAVWVPIYLKSSGDEYADDVLLVCMAVYLCCNPLFGYWSDKWGNNYLFTVYTLIASIVLIFVVFIVFNFTSNVVAISFFQVSLAFVVSAEVGQVTWTACWMNETRIRVTVIAIAMNISCAILSSTVSDIQTELADSNDDGGFILAGLYLIFLLCLNLAAIIYGNEYYAGNDYFMYRVIDDKNQDADNERAVL